MIGWLQYHLNFIHRKRYLTVSLSIILFLSIIYNSDIKIAYAASDSDYEFTSFQFSDGNNQTILDGDISNVDGTIYLYGLHKENSGNIGYHTVAYNFNLDSSGTGNNKGTKYDKGSFSHVRLERTEDGDWGPRGNLNVKDPRPGMKWDVYKLKGDDVINAVTKLMKDKGMDGKSIYTALAKGVPVKISNEFEIINGKTGEPISTNTYKSLPKMRNSVKDLLGVEWSSTTYNDVLPYYYDNEVIVKLNDFDYMIKYVEKDNFDKYTDKTKATVLKKVDPKEKIMYGQELEYDLGDKNNIKIGTDNYKYSSAEYYYSNGKKNDVTLPTCSGNIVSTTHYRHYDGILYIVLEKTTPTEVTPTPTTIPQDIPGGSSYSSSIGINHFDANATGVINADSKGYEKFDVTQGIPTTENLYCVAQGSQYLINAKFSVNSGTKVFPVYVSKTYTVIIPPEEPEEPEEGEEAPAPAEPTTETHTVNQTVYIEREYQYTEIDSIDYYKISSATISNTALPGGSVRLVPTNYSVPSLTYSHYSENEHIVLPKEANSTITLPSETVEGEVPNVNFTSEINGRVGQIKVKNDQMMFGGSTVLDSSVTEKIAPASNLNAISEPSIISDSVMYMSGLTISSTLSNSCYYTNGEIEYSRVVGYNSYRSGTLNYSLNGLNDVNVHTPVVCDASLDNDNCQYVQLVNSDLSCVPLVLDENGISSDFTVNISNMGVHLSQPGYYTKNYVMNTLNNASYIATNSDGILRNEVKFPFDVLIDIENDKNISNDILLSKNTWYATGLTTSQRFYLPMYVECGKYQVDFRTVAVNGESQLSSSQSYANTSSDSYVAVDSVNVQVSGKVYGLSLYDVDDNTQWSGIFRKKSASPLKILNQSLTDGTLLGKAYDVNNIYYYTIGTNNQYGINTGRNPKYTFPLLYGSHPSQKNQGVLKAGYTWRFTLDTTGSVTLEDSSKIVIQPKFYYVDQKGNNREEVDLYYSETINGVKKNVVKVGSEIDWKNEKVVKTSELGIPEKELKNTANVNNVKYTSWIAQKAVMYNYNGITTKNAFKTFSNITYANSMLSSTAKNAILSAGYNQKELSKYKQSYYFTYSMPSSVKAVTKGTNMSDYKKQHSITYKEDFWKKDGYIIVNFDITVIDKNGNAYVSYINSDNYLNNDQCCMWLKEGAQKEKTDYYGNKFSFKAGDCIMFNTDSSSKNDYISGGIN